jgi:hypothetical protein
MVVMDDHRHLAGARVAVTNSESAEIVTNAR